LDISQTPELDAVSVDPNVKQGETKENPGDSVLFVGTARGYIRLAVKAMEHAG